MKLLNGKELSGFIKERQAKEVRRLKQTEHIQPKLVILKSHDDPVIDTYVRLKKSYGADIGVEVEIYCVPEEGIPEMLDQIKKDHSVNGVIVQLPLSDKTQTETICSLVPLEKDVDSLNDAGSSFDAATPTAILWLLAGYNVDLAGKKVYLVGKGKLVGAPLERMMKASGVDARIIDRSSGDLKIALADADVIVTATGKAGLITSDIVPHGCVVVDAGVAVESGRTVGDVAEDVYERDDVTVTPVKGGVGPLTVCALFENVLKAARLQAPASK